LHSDQKPNTPLNPDPLTRAGLLPDLAAYGNWWAQ
jgi:hypothetical protein